MTYPDSLEVANTSRWDGWVPYLGGLAFLNAFNVDTYVNLKPKAATESGGGSSSATTWIVVGVVAALVVIVLIVVLARRGRGRTIEE